LLLLYRYFARDAFFLMIALFSPLLFFLPSFCVWIDLPLSSFVDGRHNYPDAFPEWMVIFACLLASLPASEGKLRCSQAVMTGQAIRSRGIACRD